MATIDLVFTLIFYNTY